MNHLRYPITPVPKPRMTQRDKWQKRPAVLRYRAYCDELRSAGVSWRPLDGLLFLLPMPRSWSARKREENRHKPHLQRPDLDNLIKGVWDALFPDGDEHCWAIGRSGKLWADEGAIVVVQNSGELEDFRIDGE